MIIIKAKKPFDDHTTVIAEYKQWFYYLKRKFENVITELAAKSANLQCAVCLFSRHYSSHGSLLNHLRRDHDRKDVINWYIEHELKTSHHNGADLLATKEIEVKKDERKTQFVAIPLVTGLCQECRNVETFRSCGYGCHIILCAVCEIKHNKMHKNFKQVVCVNPASEMYHVPASPNNSEQYDICTISIQMIANHLQSNPGCKMVEIRS